jgi:hypothetical protein
VPPNAAVSVGCLWGGPWTRTCGIFVGHAEGQPTQVAVQGLRAPVCETPYSSLRDSVLGHLGLAISLTPAYVRWHRRITAAACLSSPWDGSLICEVSMVAPWPAELSRTKTWCRDRGWRDWPQLFGQYAPPSERDLTRAPHLRASLLIQAPVPLDRLPPAPAGPADDAPGQPVARSLRWSGNSTTCSTR